MQKGMNEDNQSSNDNEDCIKRRRERKMRLSIAEIEVPREAAPLKWNIVEYKVLVGKYSNYNFAEETQERLLHLGYLTELKQQSGSFVLTSSAYPSLEEAVILERILKKLGFPTMITAD